MVRTKNTRSGVCAHHRDLEAASLKRLSALRRFLPKSCSATLIVLSRPAARPEPVLILLPSCGPRRVRGTTLAVRRAGRLWCDAREQQQRRSPPHQSIGGPMSSPPRNEEQGLAPWRRPRRCSCRGCLIPPSSRAASSWPSSTPALHTIKQRRRDGDVIFRGDFGRPPRAD
jgi:hypothetical protein